METVQGYVILKAATFETGHGFALGHNPGAPSPFVTRQFTEGENAHRAKRLSADRTGPQLRGDAFRCQRRLKLRVKGQDSLTEVTAVRPCPALVQHIAGTVKRKA